nr:hypothetical protein Itr_chr07CG08330 [Ipomoea trifida]
MYWMKICNGKVVWNAAKTNAKYIVRNDMKAIRYALAVNFTGRISNMQKVYRNDLFHLCSMEMGNTINMGVMCKRWLTTQSQNNTTNIFIGPLLSRLCKGLNLEGKLRRERRIASMSSITIANLNRAKLTPIEEGEEEAPPTSRTPSMPNIPSHFATVHDWESMQSFQYQLHLEHMAELRTQREEIRRNGQAIEDLQVQFTQHFHPQSFDGRDI